MRSLKPKMNKEYLNFKISVAHYNKIEKYTIAFQKLSGMQYFTISAVLRNFFQRGISLYNEKGKFPKWYSDKEESAILYNTSVSPEMHTEIKEISKEIKLITKNNGHTLRFLLNSWINEGIEDYIKTGVWITEDEQRLLCKKLLKSIR